MKQNIGTPDAVKVWDLPVRVFHWLLVALVLTSWSAYQLSYMEIHKLSGIAILSLVLTRLVWGVVGSTTARFSRFLRGPSAVVDYVKGLKDGTARPSLGHSPVGGWAVVALLGACLVQGTLGLFSNDDFFFDGPLVKYISKETSDRITAWHETFFSVLVALIVLHVLANLYYLKRRKDNLIRPMVTGRKKPDQIPDAEAAARLDFRPAWLALVLWAVVGGALWYGLHR